MGVAVGATVLNTLVVKPLTAFTKAAVWPWPYAELDVEAVRIAAHDAFWSGKGCSYGAFYGIVAELEKKLSDPNAGFPCEIMIYGHGGDAGWGGDMWCHQWCGGTDFPRNGQSNIRQVDQ
ncbi:MAG: hypothetical protein JXA28_00280 [Bacteroidetes bacterium]|nr:hypothetical protein [Bacteroidota bacterium]